MKVSVFKVSIRHKTLSQEALRRYINDAVRQWSGQFFPGDENDPPDPFWEQIYQKPHNVKVKSGGKPKEVPRRQESRVD